MAASVINHLEMHNSFFPYFSNKPLEISRKSYSGRPGNLVRARQESIFANMEMGAGGHVAGVVSGAGADWERPARGVASRD